MNKYLAEVIGTFWLVLGGCGSAVFSRRHPRPRYRIRWRITGVWSHRSHHAYAIGISPAVISTLQ